jgi:hypothetical protein
MIGLAVWVWSDIMGEGDDGGPADCFLRLTDYSFINLIGGGELLKVHC